MCPNPRLAGRSCASWAGRFFCSQAYFEHSVGFRSDTNVNLMHDVPFILAADFDFPPGLWQDHSMHGGNLWIQKLEASVVPPEGSTHTCRTGSGRKADIIDNFMMSTRIRPLIQKCEVVKSVPWSPHYGVKLVLHIDFESVKSRRLVGKISK